jgi:hypothetical protein
MGQSKKAVLEKERRELLDKRSLVEGQLRVYPPDIYIEKQIERVNLELRHLL